MFNEKNFNSVVPVVLVRRFLMAVGVCCVLTIWFAVGGCSPSVRETQGAYGRTAGERRQTTPLVEPELLIARELKGSGTFY